MVTHQGCPQTPGRRRGPRTGDVSVSGLAGITPSQGEGVRCYRNGLS